MEAMAPVELVGLLISALLVGSLVGGFLVARASRLSRRAAHEEQFIQALIDWLACRQKWRQASARLVKCVRKAAQTPKDSLEFKNHCRAAQRAKRSLRRAQDDLTLAEAKMETWRGDALHGLTEPPLQPTAMQVRRVAIRGGADRLEWLRRRLDLAEAADLEWVRAERVRIRARRSLLSHMGVWSQAIVYKVLRTWERPR